MRGHAVDEHHVHQLVRAQRRLAIAAALLIAAGLGALPLAFAVSPDLFGRAVGPFPSLAWLLVCPGVYPLLVVVGRSYARRAGRIEEAWTADQR